jgi:hypothetical protein
MRIFVSLVFASLNLTLAIVPAYTQQQEQNSQERNSFRVRLETPGGSSLWDDSRSELIVGNSHRQGDRSTARVDIYNVVSGEKRSIDILKEFPNARYVYVEGLAVSPEGSILVACEVDSNEAAFAGDRLLLYDRHSALTTSLLAGDYDVGAVALDRQSNMYILGSHDGELSSKEPYPLLVKYDSYGHITSRMLPRFSPTSRTLSVMESATLAEEQRASPSTKRQFTYIWHQLAKWSSLTRLERYKRVSMWPVSFQNLQRRKATKLFVWTGTSSRPLGTCGL